MDDEHWELVQQSHQEMCIPDENSIEVSLGDRKKGKKSISTAINTAIFKAEISCTMYLLRRLFSSQKASDIDQVDAVFVLVGKVCISIAHDDQLVLSFFIVIQIAN